MHPNKPVRVIDYVIIGAGPAGISAAMHLAKHKIKHCLIEKDTFPRDKICGDAISGKVTDLLRQLDPELTKNLMAAPDYFRPCSGVIFSSPEGEEVKLPFQSNVTFHDESPGYIVKRYHFDNYLYENINHLYTTVMTGMEVEDVSIFKNYVLIETAEFYVKAKVLLSAEGSRAMVAKKYLKFKVEPRHYCAGLRAYYRNVKDFSPEGYIELHFVKEALPGYFWIFPLPNGEANVGIGMLSKYVSAKKVNLKKMLQEVIQSERFKARFEEAELIGKISGWGLPLGSKKRRLHGHRFMVLGDAGSLIDPFTGEGIGNAMLSGKVAADVLAESIEKHEFSWKDLRHYTKRINRKLRGELRLSTIMQRLAGYPRLFNWVMRKINGNDELRNTITFMFEDVKLRKKFANPFFYIKLLLDRKGK